MWYHLIIIKYRTQLLHKTIQVKKGNDKVYKCIHWYLNNSIHRPWEHRAKKSIVIYLKKKEAESQKQSWEKAETQKFSFHSV